MSQLRVAHVVNQLALGGMEYNVVKLLNNLDRGRFLPYLYSLRSADPDARDLLASDVPVGELHRHEGRDLAIVPHLARRLRTDRIQVVHSHNWSTFLYTVAAARFAGVPVVVQGEHGLEVDNLLEKRRRILARRLLSVWTDRFVGVSCEICDRIASWGIAGWRITLIPNGVDLSTFGIERDPRPIREALDLQTSDPIVATVGGFRSIKDFGTLLRAFGIVHRTLPSAWLLLIGRDPTGQFDPLMERESRHLGTAAARIRHLGVRMDIPELMSVVNVYVNSSLYEGMSNTILEAMACRKPVVATRVGGTPELVSHGENGLLAPPADPEAIARCILELLSDPSRAAAMGEEGRRRIERHHSFARMIELNSDLYETQYERKTHRLTASSLAKIATARLLTAAGVARGSERVQRGTLVILTYHRILPLAKKRTSPSQPMILTADVFRLQMAELQRRYRVLPLEEVLDHYRTGRPFPERAVHVTFDDGYVDNYEHALPVLDRYSIPATLFLATGPIDTGSLLWWDALGQALLRLQGHRPPDSDEALRLAPPAMQRLMHAIFEGRSPAIPLIDACTRILNRTDEGTRLSATERIEALAAPLADTPPPRLMLTWDQVREMHRCGVALGGHTVRHTFLSELDDRRGREEVNGCIERIEEETGSRPYVFSYPSGRTNERSRRWFAEAGVKLAMTTVSGRNRSHEDPLTLKRWDAGYLSVENRFSHCRMRLELSGAMDWATRLRLYGSET